MTSARLLMLVRELSPSSFSDSMIMMWISEIEYALATDISEVDPSRLVELTEPTQEPMLIPHPFDRVYLPYVQAMIANAQGEPDLYQNYIAKFNAYRDEWAQWVLNGRQRRNAYYIDAYQLAREHGFEGSIDEWLDGLKGDKGDKGDSVLIKGHYDTLARLEQAHPVGYLGDYYEVGTAPDDAVVYYWDPVAHEWHGIDIVDGQRKAREAAAEAADSAEQAARSRDESYTNRTLAEDARTEAVEERIAAEGAAAEAAANAALATSEAENAAMSAQQAAAAEATAVTAAQNLRDLTYVEYGANLYDMDSNPFVRGNIGSTGAMTTDQNSKNVRTSYIPVNDEGQGDVSIKIVKTGTLTNSYVAEYDVAKKFVKRASIGNLATAGGGHKLLDKSTRYIALLITAVSDDWEISSMMINYGTEILPFEPYHEELLVRNERLKMPKLTFTGGAEAVFDGHGDLTVEIPGSGKMPDYYEQELQRVTDEVLRTIRPGSVAFAICADLHYNTMTSLEYDCNRRQAEAMRELGDRLPIDLIVTGGDLLTRGERNSDLQLLNDHMVQLGRARVPHLIAKGDHESAQSSGVQISKSEFAARTYPYMQGIVACGTEPNNYYYDIPNRQTRVIVLDTGTAMAGQDSKGGDYANGIETAYKWMLDDVLTDEIKDGWKIIIISHAPHDFEWNVGMYRTGRLTGVRRTQTVLLDIMDALNGAEDFNAPAEGQTRKDFYFDGDGQLTQDTSGTAVNCLVGSRAVPLQKDFTGWTSKVVLLAGGHTHCDRLNRVTNGIERSYAIGCSGAGNYNGVNAHEDDYYQVSYGSEGLTAKWEYIRNRQRGTIREALIDIYICDEDRIDRIRFGAGESTGVALR